MKKTLSILLLLCMVFSLMPMSAFADEAAATEEPALTELTAEEAAEPEAEPETEESAEQPAEEPAEESAEEPTEEPAEQPEEDEPVEEPEPVLTAEEAPAPDGDGFVCYIDADSNDSFDENDVQYASITAALAVAKPSDETSDNPTVIRMIADSNENVKIASGRFITLDLNGYVLKGTGTYCVISNSGTLTIKDSDTAADHYYTVASTGLWTWDDSNTTNAVAYETLTARPAENAVIAVKGGCITGGMVNYGGGMENYGTVTMTGGNIIGNTANYNGGGIWNKGTLNIGDSAQISGNTANNGGGIYILSAGTVTMTGGSITENSANYGGGMYNYGTLNISGGSITGNKVSSWAGGINNYGTINMTGGTVSGNSAATAGGVCNEKTLNIGGTAVITGNTAKNIASNMYLDADKKATISTETPFAEGAQIGVTLRAGTGDVTGTNSADYSEYFFSDNTNYAVKNDRNTVKLVDGYAVTCANCENGSVSVGIRKSAYSGETVTVTATPADGYALGTLYYIAEGSTDKVAILDGEFTMPASDITIYATFTEKPSIVCYIDANSNSTFDGNDVKYASITDALAAEKPATETQEKPTVIRMIANSFENITIGEGRFITLDLNGYVLKNVKFGKYNVIQNYGHLTVTDSNSEAIHYYTSYRNDNGLGIAFWDDSNTANAISIENLTEFPASGTVVSVKGGAVTGASCGSGVKNEGTFILEGGNLIANMAIDGSGGGVWNGGTFNMNGGMICLNNGAMFAGGIANTGTFNMNGGAVKCNIAVYGGGVVNTLIKNVEQKVAFTMTGGAISDNAAALGGGVVNMDLLDVGGALPEFTMLGGSITNNKASDPSGYASAMGITPQYNGVFDAGKMTVGKTAVISGNTYNGKTENLCTCSTIDIATGDDAPVTGDDGMKIGVTTVTAPTVGTSVRFTTNGEATDLQYFFSDSADYTVKYNESEYLELIHVSDIPTDVASATYSAYLALNENIDICLKIKSLGTGFSKDKLSVTVNSSTIDNNKITVKDNAASCVLAEVAPQNIDTVFNVVVTYDGVVVKSFSYSAVKYCNSVFAKYKSGNKLYDLCEALLNYGKCAGSSVTVSDDHTKNFTSYDFGETIPTSAHSGTAIGASLSIDEIITLKYEVEANEELTNTNEETQNFYVMIGDKQIDPNRVKVTSNGENSYTVSIDLYASQLSESYTLVPKDKTATGDFSVTYSAYNYCEEAQEGEESDGFTEEVKTLCKAIHNYGEAVKAYNSK